MSVAEALRREFDSPMFGKLKDDCQRLFAFAGILRMILARGITRVVDEIENSLHPLLIHRIVALFFSPETNPNGACYPG